MDDIPTAAGGASAEARPAELWDEALDRLRQQLAAETFDRLLLGSQVIEAGGGVWRIGVRPYAVDWLAHRARPLVERAVAALAGADVRLEFVALDPPPVQEAPPAEVPSALETLLSFDPNSSGGGGFWKMGHYANWFWAAHLGPVAWRVYELVVSGDRRLHKTQWTPPRRYSISELARAIAGGRQNRPNREQIRGRFRTLEGGQVWRPGAFDRLVEEGVARIQWHPGDGRWRPWQPGGLSQPTGSGLRTVYRISVVATLPLLTPRQVACLPAENQAQHERYLAERSQDLAAWEQIGLRSMAGLDPEAVAGGAKEAQLTPGRQSLTPGPQSRP